MLACLRLMGGYPSGGPLISATLPQLAIAEPILQGAARYARPGRLVGVGVPVTQRYPHDCRF